MASSGTSEPSNSDVMNALTVSDVKNFGGLILAGLAVEEVKLIRDKSVKSEVIAAIGKIPQAELMPISHPEKLPTFTPVPHILAACQMTLGQCFFA